MDDSSAARRANFGIVKDEKRTSSGVVPASLDTSAASITVGTVLDARYLVGRVIGAGAAGIVFEARNIETEEKVAIKCPRHVDEEAIARFTREATTAASIKSDYACAIHDVGATHEGVPYLVMEFLDGPKIGTIVEESGAFGPRTAVEYTLQACEALAAAHVKGMVHGAVSPANLLLRERPDGMRAVKVVDFGVSKIDELSPDTRLTASVRCMSPEQVRRSDVDVRSDVWSVGIVLYELLTGRAPLGGASIAELRSAILEKPVTPLAAFRSDLPSGLGDVLAKCLEKDRDRRYASVADLAIALAPFAPKRTRLNVDRVVSILQGRELDLELRMASTTPPPGAEALLLSTALPPSLEEPTPIEALAPLETLTHGSVAAPIAEVLAEIARSDAVPTPRPGAMPALKPVVAASNGAANTVVTPVVAVSPASIAAASRDADAIDQSAAPPAAISSDALVSTVVVPASPPAARQKPLVLIAAAAGVLVLAVIGVVVFSSSPSPPDGVKVPSVITTTRAEPKLESPAPAAEPAVTVNVVRPEAPPPPRPSAAPPPTQTYLPPPPAPRPPPPAASSAPAAPSTSASAPEPSTTGTAAKPSDGEEAPKQDDGERTE